MARIWSPREESTLLSTVTRTRSPQILKISEPSHFRAKFHIVIRLILALALICALVAPAGANPRHAQEGETQYLENADRYIREGPVEVMTTATPTPIAKKISVPMPKVVLPIAVDTDDDEEENGERTILGYSKKVRPSPPAIIHNSRIFVGEEVPYPKDYSAPVIQYGANGIPYVTPSQPLSFTSRPVGVSMESNGSGQSVRMTELEGWVNYGNPIQTAVPVYNEKGEVIGTRVITTPNNILQPVIKTYRQDR